MVENKQINLLIKAVDDLKGFDNTISSLQKLNGYLNKYHKTADLQSPQSLTYLSEIQKQFKKAGIAVNELSSGVLEFKDRKGTLLSEATAADTAAKSLSKLTKVKKQNLKAIKEATKADKYWALNLLSVMFIAQQLSAVLSRFTTSSVNSFMDVTDSSNVANQSITKLSIAGETLKIAFGEAIGEALGPFADTLMDLSLLLGEFVINNGEMTGGIVLLILAIATLLGPMSQFVMLLSAISNLAAGRNLAGFIHALKITGAIFIGIVAVIALVIALIAIWNSDMSTTEKVGWTVVAILGIIAAAALLIGLIFGLLPVIMVAAAVLALAGLLALIVHFREEIALVFIKIAKLLVQMFAPIYDMVVNIINAFNSFLGKDKKFRTSAELIDDLTTTINYTEADMKAEKMRKQSEKEASKASGSAGMLDSLGLGDISNLMGTSSQTSNTTVINNTNISSDVDTDKINEAIASANKINESLAKTYTTNGSTVN